MANKSFKMLTIIILIQLFNSCSSTWPQFQRDFLFLPKLVPKRIIVNNPTTTSVGRESSPPTATLFGDGNHPQSRTMIFNRNKLDPSNTNVYQDSATMKMIENNKNNAKQLEEEIILDDETRIQNNSNVYVPVMLKNKDINLKQDTSNSRDVSLHGNNFQKATTTSTKRPKLGAVNFMDALDDVDDDDAEMFFKSKPEPKRIDHHHHNHHHRGHRSDKNDDQNRNQPNPFNDDSIRKEFENFFKFDDLKDFFNSKIVV